MYCVIWRSINKNLRNKQILESPNNKKFGLFLFYMVSLLLTESRKTSIWLCESQGTGSNPVRHPTRNGGRSGDCTGLKIQGSGLDTHPFHPNGECSSIGRALVCGAKGSGIVTRHSPCKDGNPRFWVKSTDVTPITYEGKVTKRVNGGTIGLAEREAHTEAFKEMLGIS